MTTATPVRRSGQLALEYTGQRLPLQVLKSTAGYYIGTATEEGPCSRESLEYWPSDTAAQQALSSSAWTQRDEP